MRHYEKEIDRLEVELKAISFDKDYEFIYALKLRELQQARERYERVKRLVSEYNLEVQSLTSLSNDLGGVASGEVARGVGVIGRCIVALEDYLQVRLNGSTNSKDSRLQNTFGDTSNYGSNRLFSGQQINDGAKLNTFGIGNDVTNKMLYNQKQNDCGYTGTCGLASAANIGRLAGQDISVNEVVQYAVSNNLCDINGGTSREELSEVLNGIGIPNHYCGNDSYNDDSYNEPVANIANLVENGYGVILGVNAGYLWNDIYQVGDGGANHAISVIGTARNAETNELVGLYICDTGRTTIEDIGRFIRIDEISDIYNVVGGVAIITNNPIR
ncbi:MAG: hypothetical protein ACYDIA_07310 [Candidatus Humimicrobiaceae bacterium]